MSEYNWCHGPSCHKHETQDRVRGVKGEKVLRTRKIATNSWNVNNFFSHFCSQGCWNDFAYAPRVEFIRLYQRAEARETPIEVSKVKHPEITHNRDSGYSWTQRAWTETKIEVRQD